MERPLCPLCKTKHFAREAHVFEVGVGVSKAEGIETSGGAGGVETKGNSAGKTRPVEVGGKGKEIHPGGVFNRKFFDRVTYQREYMRSWRLRQKKDKV